MNTLSLKEKYYCHQRLTRQERRIKMFISIYTENDEWNVVNELSGALWRTSLVIYCEGILQAISALQDVIDDYCNF